MDTLTDHVQDFLIHIRIEKNYSLQTEQSYSFALSIFLKFLAEENLDITDKKCIIYFISYLKERGNSVG